MLPWLLLIIIILGATGGQLCMKRGMAQIGPLELESIGSITILLKRAISNHMLLISIAVYIVVVVAWLILISKWNLSFAYPLLALTFALIPIASHFFLNESISALQWVGIGIIIAGVVLIAQTGVAK